jgi:hypothetical protein
MTAADATATPTVGAVMPVVKSGVPAPEATVEAPQHLANSRVRRPSPQADEASPGHPINMAKALLAEIAAFVGGG